MTPTEIVTDLCEALTRVSEINDCADVTAYEQAAAELEAEAEHEND